MKYSTAKSILKVYRSEGRAAKIPRSQRFLSLRTLADDYSELLDKPVKTTRVKRETEESTYSGPRTRLRTGKNQPTVKLEKEDSFSKTTDCKSEEIEGEEPSRKKKVKKEIVPKLEAEPVLQNIPGEKDKSTKQEDLTDSPIKSNVTEEKELQSTSQDSSANTKSNILDGLQTDEPPRLPENNGASIPLPTQGLIDPARYYNYQANLAQIRARNMAMYMQSLRFQNLMLNYNYPHSQRFGF